MCMGLLNAHVITVIVTFRTAPNCTPKHVFFSLFYFYVTVFRSKANICHLSHDAAVISVSMLLNVHLAAYHFLSVLGESSCVANQEGKKTVFVISDAVIIGIGYS